MTGSGCPTQARKMSCFDGIQEQNDEIATFKKSDGLDVKSDGIYKICQI